MNGVNGKYYGWLVKVNKQINLNNLRVNRPNEHTLKIKYFRKKFSNTKKINADKTLIEKFKNVTCIGYFMSGKNDTIYDDLKMVGKCVDIFLDETSLFYLYLEILKLKKFLINNEQFKRNFDSLNLSIEDILNLDNIDKFNNSEIDL